MKRNIDAIVQRVIKKLRLNDDEKAQFLELRVFYLAAAAQFASYALAQAQASWDQTRTLEDPVTKSEVQTAEKAYQEKLKAASPRVVDAMKMFIEEFG